MSHLVVPKIEYAEAEDDYGRFIAEPLERGLGITLGNALRRVLRGRLQAKGVNIFTGVKYEQVTPEGIGITTEEGESKTIPADTIVLAAGAQPNLELLASLEEYKYGVYLVGDCVEPRGILEAMAEGHRIGRSL